MVTRAPAVNTPVQQIVLDHVSWETYESLLADYVDSSVPHFTYDRGKLEIVSPSIPHETDSQTLGLLIELVAAEWETNIRNVGSATFKRKDLQRGFEADMTFYIHHEGQVRDKQRIDLSVDPPPDLLIEIEVTNSAIAKLPIYAEIGVPEVWRIDGDRVTVLALDAGDYRESAQSISLPPLDGDILSRFLVESRTMPRTGWIRAVRAWALEHAAARQSSS